MMRLYHMMDRYSFIDNCKGSWEISAVDFTSYQGWSHTDAILEMPMNANHRFHKDVFDAVQEWTLVQDLKWPDEDAVITKRLCPAWMVSLGQSANPF